MTSEPSSPTPDMTVFRPRGARIVAWGLFGAIALAAVVLVLVAPMILGAHRFQWHDQLFTLLFAALVCWGIYRQASVRIVPTPEGLTVRNVFSTVSVTWEEVVAVRYGPDHPWARLDISDGTTLAAMGIQVSDGAYAQRQARRLATLVKLHEPPDH